MSSRTASSAGLADYLQSAGAASPRIADAIRAVPRAGFLPDLVWAFDPDTGKSVAVDRRVNPDRWNAVVNSDTALTIQWDDGNHHGTEPGTVPTSSASQPSVVAGMLEDARLEPGMRVLKAGTGTGWSAALTACITGPGTVVSIEYDQYVAELAARNLNRGSHQTRLVVGDAAEGWPVDAPYDRVVATYGVRRIPPAWIAQTRPSGLVVAPWGTAYSHRDAVVVLTVNGDGTATGKFTRPVEFMKARNERTPILEHGKYMTASPPGPTRHSTLTFDNFIHSRWSWDAFVTGLLVPGVTHVVDDRERGAPAVWWYSLTDLSWAVATFPAGGLAVIESGGERDVWGEVKAAVVDWNEVGRPGIEQFGLAVAADGAHVVFLDDPVHAAAAVHRP